MDNMDNITENNDRPEPSQDDLARRASEVLRKIMRVYAFGEGQAKLSEDNTLVLSPDAEAKIAERTQAVLDGKAPPMTQPLVNTGSEAQWPERRDKIYERNSLSGLEKADDVARELMTSYTRALELQMVIMAKYPRNLLNPVATLQSEQGEAIVKLYTNYLTRQGSAKLKALGIPIKDAMALNGALIRYSIQANILNQGNTQNPIAIGIEPMVGKVDTDEKLQRAIHRISDYADDRKSELLILHKTLKGMSL